MRPLILISNDDGIDSPYLVALANSLEQRADADVLVIAPERQRSAMSHTITLHKPLRVQERAVGRMCASGSPVDCVYLGLMKLAPRPPALVVSGINDGFNLGSDVFYSGTVAAAVEGGLRGINAIALSLEPGQAAALGDAVEFATALVRAVLRAELPRGTVLNVNVPAGSRGRYRWTRLGKRHYEDDVHRREDPRGRAYYWIGGGVAGIEEMAGSDCDAVAAQITSVTPLRLDLTAHDMLGDRAPALEVEGFALQP